MSSTYRAIIIIGLIFLVGGAVYSVTHKRDHPAQNSEANFIYEGNLLRDNPGLIPGVWYLSYEQPGQPGLSVQLRFQQADPDLQVGQRVRVEGVQNNNLVDVMSLEVLNAYKSNLIWVDNPKPNQTVVNPITLTGAAKSSWYFEASFPVKVLDANGKVLGQTNAQAQGDWTTGGYVQFLASVQFTAPATDAGILVLEKDNPSGLPQNADELRIPIVFGTEGRAVKLYYYNSNNDKDTQGNVLCSSKGLVAVDRQIPITNTPIQDTIKLLLQGKLSAAERSAGITTEFPLTGMELKGANVAGHTLTLEFVDPEAKTSGGSCRVAVLWAQIAATAKQFPGITEVKFKPAELFQP